MAGQHVGQILWTDLTVGDADKVSRFYEAVMGWGKEAVSMGEYDDYMMIAKDPPIPKKAEENRHVVGICHAKGANATLPAQWLNYFGVADLDKAVQAVTSHGGKTLTEIMTYGSDRYCVIEDPAGAVCAIYESTPKET